ncbi:MAG: DUF547 domain-containing protein [Planctomycetota bacterium]
MPRAVPVLLGLLAAAAPSCYDRRAGVHPLDFVTAGTGQDRPASGPSSRPASGPASRPTSRPAQGEGDHADGSVSSRPAAAPGEDGIPATDGLAKVLAAAVAGDTVDYAAVARHRAELDAYLRAVAGARLDEADKKERLAFWINAYNAAVLDKVLRTVIGKGKDGGDRFGVLEVPEFFDEVGFEVAGRRLSLNQIEEAARALGDPRVHFAVNCASVSCPALRAEPWTAETLHPDLDRATRAYFASPQGLVVDGDEVRVTKLLEWYAKDFADVGGPAAFLLRYAPEGTREAIRKHGITGHLEYDWALNRTRGAGR